MRKCLLVPALVLGVLPQLAVAHSAAEVFANPFTPRAQMAETSGNGAFTVVVAPNLTDMKAAEAAARAESARFCQSIGMSAPDTFRYHNLHSDHVLDAWEFGGRCD